MIMSWPVDLSLFLLIVIFVVNQFHFRILLKIIPFLWRPQMDPVKWCDRPHYLCAHLFTKLVKELSPSSTQLIDLWWNRSAKVIIIIVQDYLGGGGRIWWCLWWAWRRGSTYTNLGYPAIEKNYPKGWDWGHYPSLWDKKLDRRIKYGRFMDFFQVYPEQCNQIFGVRIRKWQGWHQISVLGSSQISAYSNIIPA